MLRLSKDHRLNLNTLKSINAMKRVVFLLLVVLTLFACSKKESDIPEDVPAWVKERMTELKGSESQKNTSVAKYSWNGKIYYNIQLVYMSCLFCDLRDENGERVTYPEITDFTSGNKLIWIRYF